MRENDEEIVIDIGELVGILVKKLPFILIAAVFCAALGFAGTKLFITPKYKASAKLIVNNRSDVTEKNLTASDITASEDLIKTYAVIITSDTVLDPVITKLELDTSYESLADRISISSVNGSQVMEISMEDADPEYARAIIRAITETAPAIIVDKVKAGSCEVISGARSTADPVSPSVTKNVLIAAMLGIVLSIMVIIMKTLLNNTCKTEEELKELLDLPVLCVIPDANGGGGNK